ncbi:MAG: ATP-binding protein [Oscillatoriaceae cyanobacterium Prado104]|nr:ATP-binding protein [Oscillatoriaceae cyanobacterium Prado104]
MIELKGSQKLPVLNKARLQVNSTSPLDGVLSWFEQLHQPSIPKSVWIRCQLALAEGFTNAVRHAHKDKAWDLPICIEVEVFAESIEIKIWDWGDRFDLEQKITEMSQRVDLESPGGRGLKLMKDIADTLTYSRTPGNQNCLSMVKYYTPVPNQED